MSAARRWIAPALLVVVALAAWQLAARWHLIADALSLQSYLVPAPSDIASSLWSDRSLLATNGWVTLREVVGGLAIAIAVGFALALVLHLSGALRRALYPLLVASQTVPIVAIAPILVVWFGFGIGPKLAIIALVCFFPVTVNTLDGLRSVDPELPKLMRTLDASRLQILSRAEVPASLPYFFSGARIAVAVAVIGAVFGEWSGAEGGLGWLVLNATHQLETPRTYAGVVLLTAMAVALFALVTLLERVAVPWNRQGGRTA